MKSLARNTVRIESERCPNCAGIRSNILRNDGLSCGDYVEQLTFLLFLKMADEQSRRPFNMPSAVPKEFAWPGLLARDGLTL